LHEQKTSTFSTKCEMVHCANILLSIKNESRVFIQSHEVLRLCLRYQLSACPEGESSEVFFLLSMTFYAPIRI